MAVVGAGFAGLRAAYLLDRAGVEVTVLEARDRVGGRVWSEFPFAGSARVERGAEFILPGHVTVERVAAELGLALSGMGMSYGVRQYSGTTSAVPSPSTQVVRTAALAVSELLDADPTLAGTLTAEQLLDRAAAMGVDRAAVQALGARVETTNGVRLADQPAGSLADLDDATADVESRRVVGGNQQVAVRMAQGLGSAVRLGHAVQRLRHSDGRVTLRGTTAGAGGFELVVDACVVAVPLLLARMLLAGLDGAGPALDLLGRLGQGHAAKLHVPLLTAPAPSAVFDVPGRWWSWTALDDPAPGQSPTPADAAPVAACFAGSAQALAALEVGAGPTRWASRLAALRPDLALDGARAEVTDWSADPWAQGAYSYPVAGAWTTGEPAEPRLAVRRVESVVLAGEWTAGAWSGFMEGALRTGERAAADVLGLPGDG